MNVSQHRRTWTNLFGRTSRKARRANAKRGPEAALRITELEDRSTPALLSYYPAENNANDFNLLNNGSLVGGTTFAAGKFGQAFSFDGINDLVTVTRQVQNDFTLAAWIKTSTATNGGTQFYHGHPIINAEVGGVTNDFGTAIINERFAFGVGNPDQTIQGTTDVVDGMWHHVAGVRQGNDIRVYVDGKLENSLTATNGGTLNTSAIISIGGLVANNLWFPGLIDDARIFNSALTGAEVATLAGQTVIAEDFAGGALPAFLEQKGPSVTFAAGQAQFNGGSDGNRTNLRTIDGAFFGQDFVAEVDVQTNGNISFFGFGTAVPATEPSAPSIHSRFHHPGLVGGRIDIHDSGAGDTAFANINTSGPHRLRFVWDATAKTGQLFLDRDYVGGAFTSDFASIVVSGADNGFTATNAHVFFGASDGVTFDNLQIRSSPPPATATTIAFFDDPLFVLDASAANMKAALIAAGYTVTSFSGVTAASWSAAVAGKTVLAIAPLDTNTLPAAVIADPALEAVIENFVSGGGGLIVADYDPTQDGLDFLNAVFEFALVPDGDAATYSLNATGAAGTSFAGGPATLTADANTEEAVTASLPAGTKIIYNNGSPVAVALMTALGKTDSIVYAGYEWASPNADWQTVLGSAVNQVAGGTVGTIDATLVAGTLTVTDNSGVNNAFTAVVSGTNLVISDANEIFTAAPAGGTLSNGGKTLTIPLASVTSLVIEGKAGSDTLSADFTGGNLPTTAFNGGTGTTDTLAIVGGATTTQTFNFANENDGSVVLAGAIAGTVNYTGLEPVTSTIDATNVILNYSGVSETITVTASGAQTQVDSTAGEIVTFDNPTGLLEINAGDGTDTVTVTSFGAGFNAALDIDGEAGTGDTVNLNAAVTYAANNNVTVAAEIINVTAAQSLSGTGSVNLTAGRNVVVGAPVSANNVSLSGDNGTSQLGTFHGVEIAANVTASGTLTVQGRGSQGIGRFGVLVWNGAVVQGGTGPGTTVNITGTGGDGFINYGVALGQFATAGTITSSGGNVLVTGFGGGTTNNDNDGVQVVTAGSRITAGGTGSVTVQGTGSALGNSTGVNVEPGGTIDSAGGNVSVTGVGGSAAVDVGVGVRSAGLISAGGAGTVTVTGTGIADATPAFVRGVILRTVLPISSGIIRSNGGAVSVTGKTTDGGIGVTQDNAGTAIGAVGVNVPISITTDSFNSVAGSTVVSGTGTTSFQPSTSGTKINLGGADVLAGSPRTLGLTDAELDRVAAGTIRIGNAATGDLTVSSPITINTNLNLAAAGGKTATLGSGIDAGTGNVTFTGATGALSVVTKLSSWTKSTVIDNGGPAGDWVPTRTTPPDAGTFTLLPVPSGNPFVNGTDAADIGGGGDAFGAAQNVEYYRTTFTLPSTTGLTARVRFSVDNNAQVFINGQEVAREVSFVVANFNSPTYPEFQINPDGTITTIQQIDQTFNFTNWIAGTNELVVAVRNTQMAGDVGGLYFRMDITIDQAITIVPSAAGVDVAGSTTTLGAGNSLGIAINGTAVDTQYQQLNVTGGVDIAGSKLLVSGAHVPASGNSFVIVNNDGTDPVVGTFAGLVEGSKVTYAGGSLYITYKGGTGNDVVLNANPTVNGTAGGDTLVVTPTASGYDYKLNADPTVSVIGTLPFTFNGLDGDDTLIAILNTFTLPSIAYNGGNQDTPASAGANAVFGDVLVVNDTTKTHTATYLGDGVAGPADNDGTVAIAGQGTITFTQLEPVDLIGLAVANVTFANADDIVTVANGKDSATNALDAIVVSGTSGGVAFEQVHLRNNALVVIHTVTGGSDGDDTISITGANNGHGNVNLVVSTGTGADLVAVTGAATFSGSVVITTGDLTIAGSLSAGVLVSGTASGSILAAAAATATTGSVTFAAGQDVTVTAAGSISAGTSVTIQADVAADADAVGATVAIDGAITAGTTVSIATGDDADSVTISAAINGAASSVSTAGAADAIVVNTTGTAPLTLDGQAAGDTYTVNVGTLNAAVSVADTGGAGTDSLNVNATAGANTFEVNTATGGDSKVVVDGTQVVNYSKTLETLNLDGADAGDVYNVFFTQGGATSFLPASVNVVDTGAAGTDSANVSGTDTADVIDANYSATRTTSGLGSSIAYANGNLEILNVFSKAGNDVVYAKAVALAGGGPVVNLDGGTPSAPTALPGDILILDVTGQAGLNTANIKTPDGSVSSTSHNLLTWVDFETIPTPIGLGGSFEFGTATSPVQAGPYVVPPPASYWIGVNGANTYPTKGYYGWNTPVNSYDRGNAAPNPAQTTFQNLLRDGNWFGPVNVSRTFSVAAVAAGGYQVSITIGDTAVVMDNVYVTIEGAAQQLVPTVFQNQFVTVTGIGSDANADGRIDIAFVDKGGTHSYWHVNAVDVRPLDLVSPVTITRADGLATALVADGLTKTTYFADGFFPNAIVTVATTNGSIVTTDVDPFLLGSQVKADATGKATFELLHPTGNGAVTLTASAAVVVDAKGSFTQPFALTPTQKLDFNSPGTPTETGYFGVGTGLYAGPASNGLGWLQFVNAGDRGAAAGSSLFRDFHWNFQGTGNRGEFNIDLPTGATQAVTVYLGDPATARDRLTVEAFNGTSYATLATEIATTKTNSLTFAVTPYSIGGGNFQIRLRFGDLGGTSNGWSVQGIEYRELASQGVLGVTPTAAVAGDGTAVTGYTISGGPAGGLATLNVPFGAMQGTDASAIYDGFQVLLDGSGGGTFAIKSPVVAAGTLNSAIALVTVNGSHAGGFTQQYTGAKVSYDFGPLAAPIAGGFKGATAATKFTPQTGFGLTSTAGDFDRNPATFPAILATATPDLYRDGASGNSVGTLRVLVGQGAAGVAVRLHAFDASGAKGNLTVTAEGGATKTLATSATTPAVFDLLGSDLNGDGILELSIAGFSTWVMNGVEVG